MSAPADLLPCPFCGNADVMIDVIDECSKWAVCCDDCGCHGPWVFDDADPNRNVGATAIEQWNRRPGEAGAVRSVIDEALNRGDGSYRP
jgi:Lar family restriction alleviation protein